MKKIKVYRIGFGTQSAYDEWVEKNIGVDNITGYDYALVNPEYDIVIDTHIGDCSYENNVIPDATEEQEKAVKERASEIYYKNENGERVNKGEKMTREEMEWFIRWDNLLWKLIEINNKIIWDTEREIDQDETLNSIYDNILKITRGKI